MIILSLIMSFIFGALLMFLIFCFVAPLKDKEPKNNVHFYVAKDNDGTLHLYMGKPYRDEDEFKGVVCLNSNCFEDCNLDKNDYANLKWEDEPVEVFINMED